MEPTPEWKAIQWRGAFLAMGTAFLALGALLLDNAALGGAPIGVGAVFLVLGTGLIKIKIGPGKS